MTDDCLFAVLGSACIKALLKHVGEIDPRCPIRECSVQRGFYDNIMDVI